MHKSSQKSTTLDSRVLVSLRTLSRPGEKDYLNDLIDRFVLTTPELIAKIERAINEGNNNAVVSLSQFLKGSAFHLGAMELARLAGNMEALASENNLKSALLLFPELAAGFEQVKAALTSNWRQSA